MSLVFKVLLLLIMSFLSLAFLTLLERKILSFVGMRIGPNKVFFLGILQPIIDAMKISNKNTNVLSNFSFSYFYLSPFMMIMFSLFFWFTLFYEPKVMNIKLSSMFLLVILTFHTIFCMFIAWSSFSKFSVISSLRIVSQLISYEGVIYMIFIFFFVIYSSFSFYFFNVENIFIFYPLLGLFWVVSVLAELSRSPFDFGESESELVSGFNLEYGSVFFSFIFMSEYSSICYFSILSSFMFFYEYFIIFSFFFFFFFIWIRSVLPRVRFDFFLYLCWKFILPLVTLNFILFIYYIF